MLEYLQAKRVAAVVPILACLLFNARHRGVNNKKDIGEKKRNIARIKLRAKEEGTRRTVDDGPSLDRYHGRLMEGWKAKQLFSEVLSSVDREIGDCTQP